MNILLCRKLFLPLALFLLIIPFAFADSGGPQQVFYVGADKHVYHQFANPGYQWNTEDLSALTSAPAAESGLTSFENARDYSQHVFYVGPNRHIYHLHAIPGNLWAIEDVTARANSPEATSVVTGFSDFWYNSNQLFYVGLDSHVHHLFSVPDVGWGHEDLTHLTGVPFAQSAITSFKDVWHDSLVTFFVGTNNHVYELFAKPGYPWYSIDLTTSTGAVPSASGLSGFVNPLNNSQSLFYIGIDQHVHHLFAIAGSSWSVEDLTALTGGPTALPQALTSFVNHLNHYEQAYYLGTDQHVYHLFAYPGSSWVGEDLTARTGAPLAASSLASFNDVWHNAEQVFFIGVNGHVYHFFARPGNPWNVEDLTALTGATLATILPNSVNSWVVDGMQVLIGGRVQRYGTGVSGAMVNLSGTGSLSTTTDVNGRYLFKVPLGGTYSISVSMANQSFSPVSKVLNRVRLNEVVDFFARGGGSLSSSYPSIEYIRLGEKTIALEQ